VNVRMDHSPWDDFAGLVDGPAEVADAPAQPDDMPDFRIPRRVARIAGLSLSHRFALGLLWDRADRGAAATGHPVLVWLSSAEIGRRLDMSRRSALRAIAAAEGRGCLIALRDLEVGHGIKVALRVDGAWQLATPVCACAPGLKDPNRCCCRVLTPLDEQGNPAITLDRTASLARRAHVSDRVTHARDSDVDVTPNDHDDSARGDVDVTPKDHANPARGDADVTPNHLGVTRTSPPKTRDSDADVTPKAIASDVDVTPKARDSDVDVTRQHTYTTANARVGVGTPERADLADLEYVDVTLADAANFGGEEIDPALLFAPAGPVPGGDPRPEAPFPILGAVPVSSDRDPRDQFDVQDAWA
jgi:hypothetical protein